MADKGDLFGRRARFESTPEVEELVIQDTCLIVPTIRDFECMKRYYRNAREHGFDLSRTHTLLITENSCDRAGMEAMLAHEGVSGQVFDEGDRLGWFKEHGVEDYADLIPRRSHAETSFGLLFMQANSQYEYGFFIDDDTVPLRSQDFLGTHMANLTQEGPVEVVSSDKRWVNVLYQSFGRHGLYPRGFPYSAMHEQVRTERAVARDVVCSQGLWTNVPDLDAVRILVEGSVEGLAETRFDETDFPGNFVAGRGNYLTVCSMNLAFRREIIPVFYQLPMDDNPWKIGRFDDIWSGVFLKRACDVLGKQIITGSPLCKHNKAPRSTFLDLNAEVPALELNEHLWEILDRAEHEAEDYGGLYGEFAAAIESDSTQYVSADFLPYMAEKMRRWVECVEGLSTPRTQSLGQQTLASPSSS